MTASESNRSRAPGASPFHRGVRYIGSKLGSSFKFIGKTGAVVAAATLAWHSYERYTVNHFFGENNLTDAQDDDGKESKKPMKRVLILPFDNLKLVEKRKSGGFDARSILQQRGKQPTIVLETKELVDIIHKAASDPNITALYADFGEGMRYPLDYAHIEEIRNAIRIFNESHRVHRSPNVDHNPVFAMARNSDPKLSMAFGYSFGWSEYFLASSFSNVYLQPRGYLDLSGSAVSNIFFRDMLNKYGIKVHVFKHGDFKTAPNAFSERGYTKAHAENVKSMIASLNDTIKSCIQTSRALKFDNVMWKSVSEYGHLTASNAKDIGLINSLPSVSPLSFMMKANKRVKEKAKLEDKFGIEIASNTFNGTDGLSVATYKRMLDRRSKLEKLDSKLNRNLQRLSELSTATSLLLSGLGIQPSKSSKEDKIAVVTVNGGIDTSVSYRVIESIRKIRDDKKVKCLVLRVNSPGGSVVSSEAILEELKTLDVPVVCSMGSYAASGGYYIATNSKRIFAQPTTLTGSIGVFLVKFDATNWAKSYGIRSDYHPHGNHGAAAHPLTPLTPGMKDNLERLALGFYDYFKQIVGEARSLTVEEVENVAQGRVWTGEQAKEVGLVDALGGLDRAITYAKSTYTNNDDVTIEHWPKNSFSLESLPDLLMSIKSADVSSMIQSLFSNDFIDETCIDMIVTKLEQSKLADKPHFLLSMDEKTVLELIVKGEPRGPKKHLKRLNAPRHWNLGKMGGVWAPKPSQGPHKQRECLPVAIILRERLKYALTGKECQQICMERCVKIDGKVRTDHNYPAGFMDVVSLEKSGDLFRLLYDTKGRFVLHRIQKDEAQYKLCRIQKGYMSAKKVPVAVTHDGRTLRFPDPSVSVNDTVKVDIATGKMSDIYKFEIGAMVMITRGHNTGRVGTLEHVEKHDGSFSIVTVKDKKGNTFATRQANVFVIGNGDHPQVTLPKGRGIKKTIIQERAEAEARGDL